MRNPFKILIIGAGPEITYLVLGPGITIRSTLSSARAARLLETEAMDLILGPQHLWTGAADREFPVDQAAGLIWRHLSSLEGGDRVVK